MKNKIITIGLCMLLFVTVFSVTGNTNINKSFNKNVNKPIYLDVEWSDNFDSYTLGQFLDGDAEDGGWKGWDNNPIVGAYVVDNESRSSSHSVEIVDDTDLIHEFSGISSGNWTFIAWQYIPSDFSGITNFLLLNTYEDGGPHANPDWSNALEFNSDTGNLKSWEGETLPLIFDTWVAIRIEFDLEEDWQEIYYDDELLIEKSWTEGVEPGGALNLAAVDLFAGDNPSTSVYYDDLSLGGAPSADPDLDCDGYLLWENVSKGSEQTGTFTVENIGGGASLLDWDIVKKPSWGEWTFNPNGGDDLEPGNPVTVQVTVVAPDEKNENFAGQIKLQNADNPDDTCTIDVKLSTPHCKSNYYMVVFQRFLQQLENIFPLFR
jgi:hypothetical protein